jgi:hypothetical protein
MRGIALSLADRPAATPVADDCFFENRHRTTGCLSKTHLYNGP